MSRVRILATTLVTLTHTFTADEQPTDAAGVVTVTVKRLDGSAVASGTASHDGVGIYSYPVTRAVLDTLTVDWSGTVGGSAVTVRDIVEVCGGFHFGLSEARSELSVPASVTTAQLAAKRAAVERECERICRRAFVPRFERAALSGDDTDRLALPSRECEVRSIRGITVDGVAWSAPDVAAVNFSAELGALYRPGGVTWPAGHGNIVVEWEHGWDGPPEDLRDSEVLRLRSMLPRTRSGIPERATSFTDQAGSTYRLSMPDEESTGIPDVDGTYRKYTRKRRAVVA